MNKSTDLETERRRRLVARLLARRAELLAGTRGIALLLADPNQPPELRSVAPDGSPWSHVTISRDINIIREEWKQESLRSLSEKRSEQLASIDEMLRTALSKPGAAWAAEARQLMALQAKMLGTDTDMARAYDYITAQMNLALNRLEAEFGGEPELLNRIMTALVGGEHEMPRAVPAQLEA